MKKDNNKCEKCGSIKAGTERWWQSKWGLCWGHVPRVSELESITNGQLSENDFLLVSDIDEKKSKKLKVGDLLEYIKQNGR